MQVGQQAQLENLNHRNAFTNFSATCACILREGWCAGAPRKTGNFGRGKFNAFTTVLAIRRGHLNCLKHAIENGCEWHPTALHVDGWAEGTFKCVRFALEKKIRVEHSVVEQACRDVLERHKEHMPEIDYINAAKAAKELHDYVKRDIQRPA